MSVEQSVGEHFHDEMIKSLKKMTPETQDLLTNAIDLLADEVERLCPSALWITPSGLATVCGPPAAVDLAPFFVISATDTHAFSFACNRWPDGTEASLESRTKIATLWVEVTDAINANDGNLVMQGLSVRMGTGGVAALRQRDALIRKGRFVPVVVVAAAKTEGVATGLITMVPLPQSLERQMDQLNRVAGKPAGRA
jgi:hypothetical protein